MRFIAKLLVFLLSLFGAATVLAYFFGFSITFPFTITEDTYVPDHRLHAVRLATAATFAYFGARYIFFQTTKLYPIQFLGIFLFFLATIGSIVFYKYQVSTSEYTVSIFWLLTSIVLYQAGKPEFRNYFRHK